MSEWTEDEIDEATDAIRLVRFKRDTGIPTREIVETVLSAVKRVPDGRVDAATNAVKAVKVNGQRMLFTDEYARAIAEAVISAVVKP